MRCVGANNGSRRMSEAAPSSTQSEAGRMQAGSFSRQQVPKSISRSGMLLFATCGHPVVCFSRSPEVAAYWADVPRDDDEGRGAVFVFDRCSLATRYRLEPFHDPIWDTPTFRNDEMEERVWLTNIAIAPHLMGFVETERNPGMANPRFIADRVKRCSEHPGLGVRTMPRSDWEVWSRRRALASFRSELLSRLRHGVKMEV